jgi:hypothetical protein
VGVYGHDDEQMKAIQSCPKYELNEELKVVFTDWTSNPVKDKCSVSIEAGDIRTTNHGQK